MANKKYKVDLMRTLWQHTYRATIFDENDNYTATIRIILGIPLPSDEIPENAPKVHDYITVLVEDTILTPQSIIEFEEYISKTLIHRSSNEHFTPTHCIFFYPSPSEALLKDQNLKEL